MFSNISWQQYCIFLIAANAIYYLGLWIFYGAKIPILSGVGHIKQFSVHHEDEPDEVITTAQHVMDELRPLFEGRSNKNELVLALQLSLQKYNQWNEPGFRDTINEFIIRESQSICSIRLSEDDKSALWK